jgi:hypothetical protein
MMKKLNIFLILTICVYISCFPWAGEDEIWDEENSDNFFIRQKIDTLIKTGNLNGTITYNNRTIVPLLWSLFSDLELLKRLLENGVDPNNEQTQTILILAAREAVSMRDVSAVKLLVNNGALINAQGAQNKTALADVWESLNYLAPDYQDTNLLNNLLSKDTHLDKCDELIQFFLDQGANPFLGISKVVQTNPLTKKSADALQHKRQTLVAMAKAFKSHDVPGNICKDIVKIFNRIQAEPVST